MTIPKPKYEDSVFINCPFDNQYQNMFPALIFTVIDCGFVARSALEETNSGESRIEKLYRIISESKYGIHDISRTELHNKLPRFNMPFELGVFLGAWKFGQGKQKKKVSLILDKDKFRFQKFISDLSGNDPQSHKNKPRNAVEEVRNWLRNTRRSVILPGGDKIFQRYRKFDRAFPLIAEQLDLNPKKKIIFNDLTTMMEIWIRSNPL